MTLYEYLPCLSGTGQLVLNFFHYLWLYTVFSNLVLLALFLLKSIIFKPKFVENRVNALAVNPDGDEDTVPVLMNASSTTIFTPQPDRPFNTVEVEFQTPDKEVITVMDRIKSGELGTLHRVEVKVVKRVDAPLYMCKKELCVKLINLRGLHRIIGEVNGVPMSIFSRLARYNAITEMRRVFLFNKFLTQYKKFLNALAKMDEHAFHPNVLTYEQVLVSEEPQTCKDYSIVQKKAIFPMPDQVLLMMPFCVMNLRTMLIHNHEDISLVAAITWSRQIAEGLQHLHETIEIAHLNLKPENILLYEGGSNISLCRQELHKRYVLKIGDCCCALLLPTTRKVVTLGEESEKDVSVYTLAADCQSRLSDKLEDQIAYDQQCLAMIMLHLLLGYDTFYKTFVSTQFPNGLVCYTKCQIIEIIETQVPNVPTSFVDLFKLIFGSKPVKTSTIANHPALLW